MAPDIQPPSAMPKMVDMITSPTSVPACCGMEVLAHDDGIHRHDAALEQAEQRRDDVERHEPVEEQVEEQRRRPAAIEPISSVASPPMRSATKPEAMRLMMPKPSMSESISAPRADAVAEVAAVGDDVHLRHGHGDAAGDAGEAQQREQHVGSEARASALAPAAAAPWLRVAAPAGAGAAQRERQHGGDADDADDDLVLRQPTLSIRCCTIGGQTAPPM